MMTTISEPGLYTAAELPMADYLADPCPVPSLSSGAAHRLLTRTPKHVWWEHPRLGKHQRDDSAAADIGSVAHDLLLGGEGKICVLDPVEHRSKPTKADPDGSIPVGWTNGAMRAARDEARSNGLTPILPGEYGAARNMAAAAHEFLAGSDLAGVLDSGEGESTIIAQVDGVWLRSRPDWMNYDMRVMLHYKTTQASASPEPFIRGVMESMGYDVSLAFYRLAFEAATLEAPETQVNSWQHLILVQEQTAPYACSLIGLDPSKWAIADDKVRRAIELWKLCTKHNRWPAYSGYVHYATPTAWQLAQAEEALQRDGWDK